MSKSSQLIWIGTVGVILSTAGCSREPSTTASGVVGARTEVNLSTESIADPDDDVAGASAPDQASKPGRETPELAMRALLDAWGDDNPEALWDALPASYQQDASDLVHLAAQRLHPEAWRWFLKIMQKASTLYQKQADALAQAAPGQNADGATDPDAAIDAGLKSTAEGCALLASLFAAIGEADAECLERLKTAEVGRLIRGKGRSLLGQFRKIVQGEMENEVFAAGFIPAVDPAKIRVVLKDSSGDSATVELIYGADEGDEPVAGELGAHPAVKLLAGLIEEMVSDETRVKVALTRVEGKWIPRVFANRWSLAVSSLKSALLEAMPDESPRENFGKPFQILAGLDMQLDLWQAQQDDEEIAIPGAGWFFLLPPDMGPADLANELLAFLVEGLGEPDPDSEFSFPGRRIRNDFTCDFERATRKALDEKGKRVAVLCVTNAEARTAYPSLDSAVVEQASEDLRLHRIDASDPQEIAEWIKTSGGATLESDLVEFAEKFSADYVVIFKLDDFGCHEEEEGKWLRGHARGSLVVAELVAADDDPEKTQTRSIYTKRFDSQYPAHFPVSTDDEPRDDFQRRFLQDLVEALSRLLYNPVGPAAPPPPRA